MGIAGRVSMLDDMGFYRVEYGDNNDGNYSEGGSSCDDAVDKDYSSSDGAVDRGNGSSSDDVIDKGNGSVDIEESVSIDSKDGGNNKAASVLVVATGVKDNDTAQKYFKYLRKIPIMKICRCVRWVSLMRQDLGSTQAIILYPDVRHKA